MSGGAIVWLKDVQFEVVDKKTRKQLTRSLVHRGRDDTRIDGEKSPYATCFRGQSHPRWRNFLSRPQNLLNFSNLLISRPK